MLNSLLLEDYIKDVLCSNDFPFVKGLFIVSWGLKAIKRHKITLFNDCLIL
jgi:hypothetical protein